MLGRRGLWLDDLFIVSTFRGKGIGQALMAYLAHIALQNQCGRFEWTVLDWNESAVDFYKSLGANILTEWHLCRLDEVQLSYVASKLAVSKGGS